MINLYFLDFEEVQEVSSQDDTTKSIQYYIKSKKLPNGTTFRIFNENGFYLSNNNILDKQEQNYYIEFILAVEITFIFDITKEEHIFTINILEKIQVLTNKLKQRLGLLDYDLQLKYQNKLLDLNQQLYSINKSIKQLTCTITQKNYFLYQNQSIQIQFNSFSMGEQFYELVSKSFNRLQNFEIYYQNTLIERKQKSINYYQIPPGASLIIQEQSLINIINELKNQQLQLPVTGNCKVMKQEIIKYFNHDQTREYSLYFKGLEIQDQEEISKIEQPYYFNYKIQDVSFYVCQRNFEALKKLLTMKNNKQVQDIQYDFPFLRNKNYQFSYKDQTIESTQTFQDINLINGDCLIYDVIEIKQQKQSKIDQPVIEEPPMFKQQKQEQGQQEQGQYKIQPINKQQIQEQLVIKQQPRGQKFQQDLPLAQKFVQEPIIEKKLINEPFINQQLMDQQLIGNNQTVEVSFEFEQGKINSYSCSLKDTFSKIRESLQMTESAELLYKNEEISDEQTLESINYQENEIIKIRFLQKQLEINSEIQLYILLEDKRTKKVTKYVAEQQEKVGEFLARHKLFSHTLYYKGKPLNKQITFYDRGIVSNEKLEIDQQ